MRITMETKLRARLGGIISIRLAGVGRPTINVGGIILIGSAQTEEKEANALCIAVISLCFLAAEQSPHIQLPQAPAPRTDFPTVISHALKLWGHTNPSFLTLLLPCIFVRATRRVSDTVSQVHIRLTCEQEGTPVSLYTANQLRQLIDSHANKP